MTTTPNSDERAAFEAYMMTRQPDKTALKGLLRTVDGKYAHGSAARHWHTWQAARTQPGMASQWRDIATGLPKPLEPVLCHVRRLNTGQFIVNQSCVNPAGTGFYVEYDDSDNPLEEVTHWQPLPPAPAGVE